ncbi:MAG: ABC transporter permease [Janthinobacterium lividum]
MRNLRAAWAIACQDLLLWSRRPLAVVSVLIPPLGMALLLVVLSLTVTQEPVALVIQSHGPEALKMQQIIQSDTDAYLLTQASLPDAERRLKSQQIAAIILIPPDFDTQVASHKASLRLTLNNVDIDFADDIRRSVDRSLGRFDSMPINLDSDEDPKHPDNDLPATPALTPINPYHIAIDEHDLRQTNVDFLHYQVLPVLILLVLNVGLLGTALLCAEDVEQGTSRLLVLAPVPTWTLAFGRLLGGFLASLIVLVPVVILCLLVGIVSPPVRHWPALIALFAATALCAAGLGAVVGTLLRGTRIIAMAASLLATYLFFLGGGFTTIAFLPHWLRLISAFNPIRYAIDGLRQALFYPDLLGIGLDLAVLTGSAIAAVIIGAAMIRRSWGV